MKRISIKNIALFAATTLLVNACPRDWLDLEPSDGHGSENALTDLGKLNGARVGLHDGWQGYGTYKQYYAARMLYSG